MSDDEKKTITLSGRRRMHPVALIGALSLLAEAGTDEAQARFARLAGVNLDRPTAKPRIPGFCQCGRRISENKHQCLSCSQTS